MIFVLQKWLKHLATWQMPRSTWLAQTTVSVVQPGYASVHIAFGRDFFGYEY